MQTAIDVIITGRVQGVMFRDFTKRKADSLGLFGEVENLENGSTRVYAEGEEERLEMLVNALKKGPLLARVDNVEFKFVKPRGNLNSFNIIYT